MAVAPTRRFATVFCRFATANFAIFSSTPKTTERTLMKTRISLCLALLLSVFAQCATPLAPCALAGEVFLDATTYYITTNAASQTITITNWPGSSAGSHEWYPSALLYNERSATTGVLIRVDHIRTRSGIMSTNLSTTTNTLWTHAVPVAVSTNYVFPGRFYVVPTTDKLVITSVSTNAELILYREILR
jgi:hypothetical protein